MRENLLPAKMRKALLSVFLVLGFAGSMAGFAAREAQAGCGCTGCVPADTRAAAIIIQQNHASEERIILEYITNQFITHKNWLLDTFFKQQVLPALMRMTEQMSVVAMHQVASIGMFLDAEQQLETQRLFQELQAQAHKDYQPSDDFCWFGTNVRSMAASEQKGRFNALALNSRQLSRHLGKFGTAGAGNSVDDRKARWNQFVKNYCDPQDNAWAPNEPGNGLVMACGNAGGNTARVNIDIDYTRAIEEPRSLDVAFTDGQDATEDEQDIMALSQNLFGHDTLTREVNSVYLKNEEYQHLYLALRSVAAKRSVAENSFDAIVGLKSAGSSDIANGSAQPKTREFLAAVLTELGVPAAEAFQVLGENPSYYAQLEILAKKIYQNPDFYANLYDKPANVARKSVALKAIDLMLDRAIFESQLRQEMAMSVLLSSRLRPTFRDINKELPSAAGGGG